MTPLQWFTKTVSAVERATLTAKLAGQAVGSLPEWEEAREHAQATEQDVLTLLRTAYQHLTAAEAIAGAHVDVRLP